jgi:hypothetical protein
VRFFLTEKPRRIQLVHYTYCENALSRNVRQPNQVLGDQIAGRQVERRPGAGEEWRAAPKHDGAEVESILIDKTGLSQALRQDWSANVKLAIQLSLQPAYRPLEVIRDKRGVGTN